MSIRFISKKFKSNKKIASNFFFAIYISAWKRRPQKFHHFEFFADIFDISNIGVKIFVNLDHSELLILSFQDFEPLIYPFILLAIYFIDLSCSFQSPS